MLRKVWLLLAELSADFNGDSFGIFYGPCSGIHITDFWIVRKRLIKMDDLYRGNDQSIYWFWHGFNLRAFAAFLIGIWPAMPGYISKFQKVFSKLLWLTLVPSGSLELGQVAECLDETESSWFHHWYV